MAETIQHPGHSTRKDDFLLHRHLDPGRRSSWLTESMPIQPADTHWIQLAKAALHEELTSLSVAILCDVLGGGGLPQWTSRNAAALERARSSYAGLATTANADMAMLTVGVQVLQDLNHAIEEGGGHR